MPEPRPLRKAPITEAIVDFRVAPPAELSDERMAAVHEHLRDRYTKIKKRDKVAGQVKIEGGKLVAETIPLGLRGHFFTTDDERTTAQFRSDGFTLNRLEPYTAWAELFPEALRLWDMYVDVTSIETVARLALRYINDLRIPWEQGDEFAAYMQAPPVLPDPIPQSVTTFLTHVTARDHEADIGINIVQRLRGEFQGGLLLDIDVYKTGPFPARDLVRIRECFSSLHEMKNRVFFNMVTERCLQLFQ